MYGYSGKILRVNLTDNKISVEPLLQELVDNYIGGRGFVAKIIYDEVPAKADPLGVENKLVVATGPLTGQPLPGSGRTHFGIISPATGIYGDANMGGHFGPELKYAGYDILVVEGGSSKPVYLYINNDLVELRDATEYWGLGCFEAEERLKKNLGEEFKIALIGPAGEKLVKYACISHDFGRQAGRTGVGAVMGSKMLKAIAVRGTNRIPLANPRQVLEIAHQMYRAIAAKQPEATNWTTYGTAGIVDWSNRMGTFPTRNFQSGYFESADNINGSSIKERIFVNHKGCMGCPIPCGKYSKVSREGRDYYVEGPEYETAAMVGGNCAVPGVEEVAYLNWVMDDLGLDTISTGNVLAFVMECVQRGFLTVEQLGGMLSFGDVNGAARLCKMIAAREGIGDLLAEGVKYVSQKLGPETESFAIHVKGLEISGYEPRSTPANLLAYMTCDIGGHHSRGWAATYDFALGRMELVGKAEKVVELQHIRPAFDNLGVCRLHWVEVDFELDFYPEMLDAVTGKPLTWDDMKKVAERVWNVTRAIALRRVPGFGRKDDMPPSRFFTEKLPDGASKGLGVSLADIETLLNKYYEERGWDYNGVPTAAKLYELGLEYIVKDLAASGIEAN